MQFKRSEPRTRRGAVVAHLAGTAVLVVAVLGAALVADGRAAVRLPGPDVAAADEVGVNVLEPVAKYDAATAQVTPGDPVERVVLEWVPTGGGKSGGSSPRR